MSAYFKIYFQTYFQSNIVYLYAVCYVQITQCYVFTALLLYKHRIAHAS